MITLISDFGKSISQRYYDEQIEHLPVERIQCACGHRGCLIRHGHYSRTVKSISGTIKLRVLRLKCRCCGRTHAVLPACVVPYSQVSLPSQITMIRFRIGSPEMSALLDGNPDLDEGCIAYVRRQFRTHWAQRLMAESLSADEELPKLIRACFRAYNRQFMQIRRGTNLLFPKPT